MFHCPYGPVTSHLLIAYIKVFLIKVVHVFAACTFTTQGHVLVDNVHLSERGLLFFVKSELNALWPDKTAPQIPLI